jgi:hypothetical protein
VKEFLSRNHILFEERNIARPEIAEEAAELGAYSAPTVVLDGEVIEGGLPQIAAALGLDI